MQVGPRFGNREFQELWLLRILNPQTNQLGAEFTNPEPIRLVRGTETGNAKGFGFYEFPTPKEVGFR